MPVEASGAFMTRSYFFAPITKCFSNEVGSFAVKTIFTHN